MKVIIISGDSATGKTYVAQKLAKKLGYTYIAKDAIKEKMYDTEKRTTWDYGWYERRAKKEFFKQIKELADTEHCVVESNFFRGDFKRLRDSLKSVDDVVEIHCRAKGLTGFKRYVRRNESGERHKGHHDRRWYLIVLQQNLSRMLGFQGACKPARINEKVLILDTTQIKNINFDKLMQFVRS